MSRMESSLQEVWQSLQKLHVAQAEDYAILVQLQNHLMGSLNVRDRSIQSLSINWGRGSLNKFVCISYTISPQSVLYVLATL